jgi:hypothetical protein
MGFLDRLFGTDPDEEYRRTTADVRRVSGARSDDEIAVERYRYLLRTAPPEAIEQVHEEAFANLSQDQRTMVYTQLKAEAPAGEAPVADDPHSLAVSATRSEMRQPGTMERAFGNVPGAPGAQGAPGFGSMFASSLMGSIAGYVIASTLMSAFLPVGGDMAGDTGGDTGGDPGSDFGTGDSVAADGAGGDFGFGDPGFGGDAGFGDAGFGDFGF